MKSCNSGHQKHISVHNKGLSVRDNTFGTGTKHTFFKNYDYSINFINLCWIILNYKLGEEEDRNNHGGTK